MAEAKTQTSDARHARDAARSSRSRGSVIAGRWRLERLLGEGGMGTVWEAWHLSTGEAVAVKLIQEAHPTEDRQRRLAREARAAAAVRRPNVVRIREALELDDGSPAIVMGLLDGETLADRLARRPQLSLEETARILLPAIRACLRSRYRIAQTGSAHDGRTERTPSATA